MTMTLHIYMPRWFQWTWFGLNPPSRCWVIVSAKFRLGKRTGQMDRNNSIVPYFLSVWDNKQHLCIMYMKSENNWLNMTAKMIPTFCATVQPCLEYLDSWDKRSGTNPWDWRSVQTRSCTGCHSPSWLFRRYWLRPSEESLRSTTILLPYSSGLYASWPTLRSFTTTSADLELK